MHSYGTELHAMHDLIHFVYDQTGNPYLWVCNQLFHVVKGAVA